MVKDSLALSNKTRTLALQGAADETRNLDRVSVCELLVEKNALRGAEDGRRDDQDGLDITWVNDRVC